jgi:uncharacterized protein YecE (DUF72 family)
VPPGPQHVIEFRNSSWWNEDAMLRFKERSYTFCSVSHPTLPEMLVTTSPCFYLRMHGIPDLFKSAYSEEELKKYASQIPEDATMVSIYFNNTYYDAAYKNAVTLVSLLL